MRGCVITELGCRMKTPGWANDHLVVLAEFWGEEGGQGCAWGPVKAWALPVPHDNPAPGTRF